MAVLKQKILPNLLAISLVFSFFGSSVPAQANHVPRSIESSSETPAVVVVQPASSESSVVALNALTACKITTPASTVLDSSLGVNTHSAGLLNSSASCFSLVEGELLTQHSLELGSLGNLPMVVVPNSVPLTFEHSFNSPAPVRQPIILAGAAALLIVLIRKKRSFSTTAKVQMSNPLVESLTLSQLQVMRC